MAFRAGGVEVALPCRRVSGLQVCGLDASPATDRRVGLRLLVVDISDDCRQIGVGQIERRHAVTPGAHDWIDAIAANVRGDERRAGQVRPALTTACIPAMAEPALRAEARAPRLHLLGRILLRGRRLRRALRRRTALPASLRCGRSRARPASALRVQSGGVADRNETDRKDADSTRKADLKVGLYLLAVNRLRSW